MILILRVSAVTADTTIISIESERAGLVGADPRYRPSVSTAGKRRMMALRCAMRCTPIASVMVMSAGRPSGITDTAMATTAWKSSTKSMPFTHLP